VAGVPGSGIAFGEGKIGKQGFVSLRSWQGGNSCQGAEVDHVFPLGDKLALPFVNLRKKIRRQFLESSRRFDRKRFKHKILSRKIGGRAVLTERDYIRLQKG